MNGAADVDHEHMIASYAIAFLLLFIESRIDLDIWAEWVMEWIMNSSKYFESRRGYILLSDNPSFSIWSKLGLCVCVCWIVAH